MKRASITAVLATALIVALPSAAPAFKKKDRDIGGTPISPTAS